MVPQIAPHSEQRVIRPDGREISLLRPGTRLLPTVPRVANGENMIGGLWSGVATPGRLGAEAWELSVLQDLRPSGLAVIHATFSTRGEGERFGTICRAWPTERRRQIRWWMPFIKELRPNSPVLIRGEAGLGRYDGNMSDPMVATDRLRTDPVLCEELEASADRTADALRFHGIGTFTGIFLKGFGGSAPWGEYYNRHLLARIPADRSVDLLLLPGPDEGLLRLNAAAALYHRLKTEKVPHNQVVVVHQQGHRGAHATDRAMIMGLQSLTGNHPNLSSNPDAANIFRLLRAGTCGWVECRPRTVQIPLQHLEANAMVWRRRFRREPADRSIGLHYLLSAVKKSFDDEPTARHVVVIGGLFSEQDIERLRSHILNLAPPGGAHPVFATMLPQVTGGSAAYLVCDFVVTRGLPAAVTDLFRVGPVVTSRNGLEPHEVADAFPPPEGVGTHESIEEAMSRLCPAVG